MKDEIRDFIKQGKAQGWTKQTLKSYRQRLNALAGFLSKSKVERWAEVKAEDIEAFARSLSRRGMKSSSIKPYMTTIRAFFSDLADKGKLLSDPAQHVSVADDDDKPLPVPPLEEDDVADLLDTMPRRNVADLRNRAHLELLYGCGLRLDESLNLDVNDLDTGQRTLRVRGKGGKERLLPVGRGALHAIRDYLAVRRSLLKGPDHGALLLSSIGQRMTDRATRGVFKAINKRRAGKRRIYPHLLRHSIAVHLLRGGADVRHVQEFLGHASLDTTRIYLRMVPGRLKEDYERSFPEIAVKA